jgi:ATP-dependent DNA ligase
LLFSPRGPRRKTFAAETSKVTATQMPCRDLDHTASWGGRTPKDRCLTSARSCSVTKSRMDGWFNAGRVGTGMSQKMLAMLHKRLQPLAIRKMPLAAPPPRDNRFGRPLELARVHWLRPELVAEITYLSWPDDGLLRHTVFVGLRENKPAREVRREAPQAP